MGICSKQQTKYLNPAAAHAQFEEANKVKVKVAKAKASQAQSYQRPMLSSTTRDKNDKSV